MEDLETGRATGPGAAKDAGGRRLGGFIVGERLGVGGMGSVYLARRETDGLAVALKLLNPVAGANEALVKRFIREAQCLLALDHINIVKAFDLGSEGGQHYICMEYVPGESLGGRIKRQGRIEPRQALEVMRQIADALAYGWRHDVVHRDLKPENILIAPDGVCKLADLGLAVLAHREELRLTVAGTIMGTPAYMSPEQARAEHDIDTRSDVYSLGCTIYHAVCGRPPFEGTSAIAILQAHMARPPEPPSSLVAGLSPGTERILLKCMAKEPGKRFQTFAELKDAIDAELASAAAAGPNARVRTAEARRDTSRRVTFDADDAVRYAAPAPGLEPRAPAPAARMSPLARVHGLPGPPSSPPQEAGQRPTHSTIHMPARRRASVPIILVTVLAAAAVLALVVSVFYILYTTGR